MEKVGRLVQYFKTVALEELRDTLHVDEAIKRNFLGGEDSPMLRASPERCPHNVLLRLVYWNTETGVIVCGPFACERNPDNVCGDPVERCDQLAAEHFRALQRFQFPDVTSPDLRNITRHDVGT